MALEVQNLTVTIEGASVVDDVSFTVGEGERVGIIGESGSGKSLTAAAILGLLPEIAQVRGRVLWQGRDLLRLSERQVAAVRGREIGIVFQEPATALNPIRTVGAQIAATLRNHFALSRAEAHRRAVAALERVRVPDAAHAARQYPHQFSGGQRQRIAIAQAMIASPQLLIADEPTTALDVTIQAGVLDLFDRLVQDSGSSLLFITHDLSVLSQIAERVIVFAEGRIVEQGPIKRIVLAPQHQITRQLIQAAQQTSWRKPVGAPS